MENGEERIEVIGANINKANRYSIKITHNQPINENKEIQKETYLGTMYMQDI